MGIFILKRLSAMVMTLIVISALIFVIINLPPSNFATNQIAELQATGNASSVARVEFLMREFSLDRPLWEQYFIWMGVMPGANGEFSGLLQGDLGYSLSQEKPVAEIVGEAIWLTILINLAAVLFIYAVALPIGAIAATKSNTWIDYTVSFIGYIGLATPNFLLALILYYYGEQYFGLPIGGLMDRSYEGVPIFDFSGGGLLPVVNWGKIGSIGMHLIIPIIVIGTAGTAAMAQRLRANLLDELNKPYVITARAKGTPPATAVVRYPLRVALNPFVADIGNLLPNLVSGSVIVSIVMSLPTLGPPLIESLRSQDHFLAGFILLFVAALTQVGMLLSDILLAILDPRIRTQARRP